MVHRRAQLLLVLAANLLGGAGGQGPEGNIRILPCARGEAEAGVQLLWPKQGQVLQPTLTRVMLRSKVFGNFTLREDGLLTALISGTEARTGELAVFSTLTSDKLNIEMFGMREGKYFVQIVLTDHAGDTRNCWLNSQASFTIEKRLGMNRSERMESNFDQYARGFKGRHTSSNAFLIVPNSQKDFAYVTVLWSDDFVDNAIVWATGLRATGSTFRRICMVARGRIKKSRIRILSRCCCDIVLTDPIQSPWSKKGHWSRYEFVLTKLRVLQLDGRGLRKIVLMDADVLVLQNIDELFWLPAPSATVNKDTLMGELEKPKLSAGIMVLEPSSTEFKQLMQGLHGLQERAGKKEFLEFIEQELMDEYFNHTYNVIPLTYNLYPELLDIMPFLHYQSDYSTNSSLWPPLALPLDHGIKVIHLWHLFNPALSTKNKELNYLQIHAKIVYRQMWRWYSLFWELHQEGLQRGAPEDFPTWKRKCMQTSQAFGSGQAQNFMPVLGDSVCRHATGLSW
eukprot:TRINITY_DN106721_c0_g1_i1.p1 TRINITY_DN106721_c0_g1~~TRINITY_DN106721_c0_g1_i1.p1  ORF type:complete len:510 (+),score=117.12 TRINITY_DN106721_c0_g1_i1:40-1569(+)